MRSLRSFARDDDLAKVFWALHTCLNLDHAFLLGGANRTHWQVLVFIAHGGHHLVWRDAKGLQRLWVQVNVDFALGAAYHRDRAHTAHVLQALFISLLGPICQFNGA